MQRWWKMQGKSVCFTASSDKDSVECHRAHGPASWASLPPSDTTPMSQISNSSLSAGSPLNPDAHVFVPSIVTEHLEPYTGWSLNNERHGSIVNQSIHAAQPKLDKYFKPFVPRKYAWPRISQDDHEYREFFKKAAVLSCDHWGAFCDKFALPFFMETQTDAHKEAVACQVDKFIVYETITFEVNVHSVPYIYSHTP